MVLRRFTRRLVRPSAHVGPECADISPDAESLPKEFAHIAGLRIVVSTVALRPVNEQQCDVTRRG